MESRRYLHPDHGCLDTKGTRIGCETLEREFADVCVQGQQVDVAAVQFVAHAEFEFGQAVQHVELGDAQARQAIDLRAALEQGGVKPASARVPL